MKVNKFKFISPNDVHNPDFAIEFAWSRPYEYQACFEELKQRGASTVHNVACGGHYRVHRLFMNMLDENFSCMHSDINTEYFHYDVSDPMPSHKNHFTSVICISLLEHIDTPLEIVFKNLYDQLQIGGTLIITFDYPTVDLKAWEKFLQVKCQDGETRLSGANSIIKAPKWVNLNAIYLSITKDKQICE